MLTAAHCKTEIDYFYVIVGAYESGSDDTPGAHKRTCVEWISDPEYDAESNNYDFALCKLSSPVEVEPVLINGDANIPSADEDLVVTGLGLLSSEGSAPAFLQDVTVPYVTHELCA